MFTEESIIGGINVTANGNLEVRRDDRVLRDGAVIATVYHRHVVSPGDDLTDEDPRVVAIANIIWTPEVIQAYQAIKDANNL